MAVSRNSNDAVGGCDVCPADGPDGANAASGVDPAALAVAIDNVVVRQTLKRDQADEWALIMAAVGVPYRVGRRQDGIFDVFVAPPDLARAQRALAANDDEARAGSAVAPDVPDRGSGALGIIVGMLLVSFQYVTGLWETHAATRWFVAGVADAQRIRAGEWWRAITAMTLHADVMHVLGNVVASVIFVSAAGRWLGPGIAAMLILIAGTGANLLTALVEKKEHLSVGASTATFAALGLVVGLQSVRRWRGGGPVRRRAWIAAGAGLALLAMLGVGAKSDVFAHAFGLGLGAVLGLVAGMLDPPRPSSVPPGTSNAIPLPARVGQVLLGFVALGVVAAAWRHALGRI
ncbi:MAG: rhomboid family intramembrane serine protease [Deltaproteobacteria bacterium]|nr:rhomboid family intramembrane serine protease [Deltaproteobacteria bacterium]